MSDTVKCLTQCKHSILYIVVCNGMYSVNAANHRCSRKHIFSHLITFSKLHAKNSLSKVLSSILQNEMTNFMSIQNNDHLKILCFASEKINKPGEKYTIQSKKPI